MKEIGSRVKESIRASGMTTAQVCGLLGIGRSTFYRKLADPGRFTMAEIDALGRLFRWKILLF